MKEYSFVFKMDDNLEKYYRNKSDDVKLQAMKKRIQAIQDIIMKFENFLNQIISPKKGFQKPEIGYFTSLYLKRIH